MGTPIKTAARTDQPFVRQLVQTKNVVIDATAVDAGNTGQTHILRAGLLLAYSTATSNYIHYSPGAGAGLGDRAHCILLHDVDLKDGDPGASASDHTATVMWIGEAVSDHVILYDAAAKVDLENGKVTNGGIIEFVSA